MKLDYLTSPSNEILSRVLAYYRMRREQLVMEGLLCGEAGQMIVHVFKFRGNFSSVLGKLDDILDVMSSKLELGRELSQDERKLMLEWANRRGEFMVDDPHFLKADMESRERMKGVSTISDLQSILSDFCEGMEISKEYQRRLHEKKQCLCYCNHD